MIWVGCAEGGELIWRAAIFQTAPGIHIGQDHGFFRRKDLRCLCHEADTAKGNDIGIGCLRLAAEFQTVAHIIGQILNFRALIIMRQDHGVPLLAKPLNLSPDINTGQRAYGCSHDRITFSLWQLKQH